MVQYPTNIYPSNATFDATVSDSNNKIAFTFNGDVMTTAMYHVYNYNTGALAYSGASGYQDHRPLKFNGQEYSTDNGYLSSLTNGNDYALQTMIAQFKQDGSAPLCDMFVLRGETQENYLPTDDYIIIEDKIPAIYEWSTLSEEGWRNRTLLWGVEVDVCEIVINGVRKQIIAYQPSTGKAALVSNFSAIIPAGTKYQIYCNYKVSPLYFFKCRTTPTVDLYLEMQTTPLRYHVYGTYSQAQNSMINYYTISLYWAVSDNATVWYKVDETEKIYSQQISYDFYDDFVLRYTEDQSQWGSRPTELYYKAVINIVTVDGITISTESGIVDCSGILTEVTKPTLTLTVNDHDRPDTFYQVGALMHNVMLHPVGYNFPSHTEIQYYRENVQTGEVTYFEDAVDMTVPTKGTFKYYVIPRSGGAKTYLKGVVTAEVTLNMRGYSITELVLRDEVYQWGTKPRYRTGDQWKFVGDIQNTTITQNGDKYLHVGYNTYPTMTRTDTNYMTGTLTAMSGYVDCVNKKYVEDIDLIRAWRDFITRPTIYMLKSQKGDVWIVNITDTPTTTYQEDQSEIPTTFSFSWAECCNVNDIKITSDQHNS